MFTASCGISEVQLVCEEPGYVLNKHHCAKVWSHPSFLYLLIPGKLASQYWANIGCICLSVVRASESSVCFCLQLWKIKSWQWPDRRVALTDRRSDSPRDGAAASTYQSALTFSVSTLCNSQTIYLPIQCLYLVYLNSSFFHVSVFCDTAQFYLSKKKEVLCVFLLGHCFGGAAPRFSKVTLPHRFTY